MDAFSYLSILLSIIVGLGLTQILTAVGRLIRHRDRVRADWLPLLWGAVLLVIYVQVWWSMFGLRHVNEWTFGSFAAVLAQTGTLYLMAAVVLPEQVGDQPVDLAAYYDHHHRTLTRALESWLSPLSGRGKRLGAPYPLAPLSGVCRHRQCWSVRRVRCPPLHPSWVRWCCLTSA